MGKVNDSYPSLVRGVSNQTPARRLAGQHGEQVNVVGDPVEGLTRRQGTVLIYENALPSTPGLIDALASEYNEQDLKVEDRSLTLLTRRPGTSGPGDHVYAVQRGGALDGQLIPVVLSSAAAVQLASGVNSVTAAGRFLVLAHNNLTTFAETPVWESTATTKQANLFVRGGAYSKTYTIAVKMTGFPVVTAVYTTPTSSYPVALSTADIPFGAADYTKQVNDRVNAYNSAVTAWIGTASAAIQPQAIMTSLLSLLVSAGLGTYCDYVQKGAVVGLVAKPAYTFEYITVDDGADGTQLRRLWKEVEDPAQLPPVTWNNFTVRIAPAGKDAYYMRATGGEAFGKVEWKESYSASCVLGNLFVIGAIEAGTLYLGASSADLQALIPAVTVPAIDDRKVGDKDSSPVPHFAGKRITHVSMFQDRLVVAAENVVTCSATGGYFTFWRSTVLSEIDSDPVEVFANGSEGDVIRQASFFDKSIVFFGDSQQYAIPGKIPLTPATASMMQSSAHKDAAGTRPLALDNFVFYAKTDKDSAFARVYQIAVGQVDDTSNSSDVGQQLSTYIKGRARAMIGVSMPNSVVVRTDGNQTGLYLFQFIDTLGGERVLDAWSRWEFSAGCGKVVGVGAYKDQLRVIMARDIGGVPHLVVDEAALTGGERDEPHLDSRTRFTVRAAATDTTHPGLAVAWGTDTTPERAWDGEESVDNLADLTAEVGIDSALFAGYNFDSYVELTSPTIRDRNDNAVTRGLLIVNNLRFAYDKSAGFDVRIKSDYEDEVVLAFRGRAVNDADYLLGTLALHDGEEVAPIDRDTSEYVAIVHSHKWLPFTITGIDWDGQTFNNTRHLQGARMTTANSGAAGGWMQLGTTLVNGYYGRQTMRMQADATRWQNGINARQNALANQNAQHQYTVARAQAALSRAQADASNKVREANNTRSRVAADLTNWSRSVNNQRRMEAAGKLHDAGVTNLLREREQSTGQTLEGRLAQAEAMGALAVHAAMSGTQGASIDGMERATRLRDQRRDFYATRQQGYADYDALQQLTGIVPQAAAGLDMSVTQADVAYGWDVGQADPLPPVPSTSFAKGWQNPWGNTLSDSLTWFADPANAAAAKLMAGQVETWFTPSTVSSHPAPIPGLDI